MVLKYFIEKSGFSVQWSVFHEHCFKAWNEADPLQTAGYCGTIQCGHTLVSTLGGRCEILSHGLLLPFPVHGRSFFPDSRAGSTRHTVAPSPVEFGSLDAGWR